MGIRFACHHCGRKLNIKRELAGKRGVCPECEGRFRVPPDDATFSMDVGSELHAAVESVDGGGGTATVRQTQIALLDEDPDAAWYVRPDAGGQFGPANADVLADWIRQGRVSKSSLVWRDGWAQWRDAAEAFTDVLDQLPDSPSSDTPSAPKQSGLSDLPSEVVIDDVPLQLGGAASIGKVRGKRTSQRLKSVGLLSGICIGLVAILCYLVWR